MTFCIECGQKIPPTASDPSYTALSRTNRESLANATHKVFEAWGLLNEYDRKGDRLYKATRLIRDSVAEVLSIMHSDLNWVKD